MTAPTLPFPPGTEVRISRSSLALGYREGDVCTVDTYVTTEESDWVVDGETLPFYWLDNENGNSFAVLVEHVEFKRSREEMSARPLPTLQEARKFLGQLCGEESATFSIDEVEYAGPDSAPVFLRGQAENGLPIVIEVKVISVAVDEI